MTMTQNSKPISSVQSLSRVWLFMTPWIAARQASLSITISRSSLRLTSNESVMLSSHLILCRPLLLLRPISPSIRVFSNESTLRMRRPKYWSFSFSIVPSKEIPGLIFRMDWLDLLGLPKHIFCLIYQLYNPESTHQVLWFLSFSLSWVPHEKLCFLSCPSIWSSRSAISDLVPLFFPWLSYCFTIYSLIENHIGFVNPTCFTVFWCST